MGEDEGAAEEGGVEATDPAAQVAGSPQREDSSSMGMVKDVWNIARDIGEKAFQSFHKRRHAGLGASLLSFAHGLPPVVRLGNWGAPQPHSVHGPWCFVDKQFVYRGQSISYYAAR